MYAFIVGFNEWVLKSFVKEMEWKRTKSKDASGLIVVKPARRGGYMPSPVMLDTVKEAKRRGIPVEEFVSKWGEQWRSARQ